MEFAEADVGTLSVKDLKALISAAGLSSANCVEISDLRQEARLAKQKLAADDFYAGIPAPGSDEELRIWAGIPPLRPGEDLFMAMCRGQAESRGEPWPPRPSAFDIIFAFPAWVKIALLLPILWGVQVGGLSGALGFVVAGLMALVVSDFVVYPLMDRYMHALKRRSRLVVTVMVIGLVVLAIALVFAMLDTQRRVQLENA